MNRPAEFHLRFLLVREAESVNTPASASINWLNGGAGVRPEFSVMTATPPAWVRTRSVPPLAIEMKELSHDEGK